MMTGDGLSACSVSDAMDRLGLDNTPLTGLLPISTRGVLIGTVYTVRFAEGGDGRFNQYLPDVSPGSIVVIDADGRSDLSVWGGLIAAEAHRLGIGGTVVHGACRDSTEIARLGYPLFSRGTTPKSCRGILSSSEVQVELSISSVAISPGDTIVVDGDGAVFVPAQHSDRVLEKARELERSDAALARAVAAGTSLSEARSNAG